MTDSNTPPVAAQGLIARFVGIITSPRATFEGLVSSPRPFGILALVALVTAVAVSAPQFTDRGRQASLDMQVKQTEKFTGQPVSDAQYTQMEKMSHYTPIFTLVGPFISFPIFTLIFTAIYWAIFNGILAGTATFKQVTGIIAHSAVITALGAALGAPVQYMQGTMSNVGPFNLGALMPFLPDGSFLANFFGSVGVFTIWGIIVTAIGLAVLYKRKTRNIAITLMAVYFLVVAGVAAFMSR
jgi:hypothetical protein